VRPGSRYFLLITGHTLSVSAGGGSLVVDNYPYRSAGGWARAVVGLALSLGVFLALTFSVAPSCARDQGRQQDKGATPGGKLGSPADNYLTQAIREGPHRWPAEKMPLRVYFHDARDVPGYRSEMGDAMRHAFEEWSIVLNKRVTFTYVINPRDADIECIWTNLKGSFKEKNQNGLTETLVDDWEAIRRATITVLTVAPNGTSAANNVVVSVSRHEVGHALGLRGHSPIATDLMYPSSTSRELKSITQRDSKTMQMLYETDPETLMRETIAAQERAPGAHTPELRTLTGSYAAFLLRAGRYREAELALKRALSLEPSVKKADRVWLATLLARLGFGLCQQGEYAEAENFLSKAAALQRKDLGSDSKELASSLHNLAVVRYYLSFRLGSSTPVRAIALNGQAAYNPAHQMGQRRDMADDLNSQRHTPGFVLEMDVPAITNVDTVADKPALDSAVHHASGENTPEAVKETIIRTITPPPASTITQADRRETLAQNLATVPSGTESRGEQVILVSEISGLDGDRILADLQRRLKRNGGFFQLTEPLTVVFKIHRGGEVSDFSADNRLCQIVRRTAPLLPWTDQGPDFLWCRLTVDSQAPDVITAVFVAR